MEVSSRVADEQAHVAMHCHDLDKTLHVSASGITCEWRWVNTQFPPDAWFATELSYSDELVIDAPGAERWDYDIETVAKSEKGFDRAVQGKATVLRWLAGNGTAAMTIRR